MNLFDFVQFRKRLLIFGNAFRPSKDNVRILICIKQFRIITGCIDFQYFPSLRKI